jgi:hypothetical protein
MWEIESLKKTESCPPVEAGIRIVAKNTPTDSKKREDPERRGLEDNAAESMKRTVF